MISLDEMWRETVPVRGDREGNDLRIARADEALWRQKMLEALKALQSRSDDLELCDEVTDELEMIEDLADSMHARELRGRGDELSYYIEYASDEYFKEGTWSIMTHEAIPLLIDLRKALVKLVSAIRRLERVEAKALQMVKGGRL